LRDRKEKVTLDRAVMAFAGAMVLVSLAGPYWLLLAIFVGANLFQAPSRASAR
jgi:hypothetical protein